MTDKARLLHDAEEAFAELRRAIAGLDADAMRRPWLGTWGVREILIHISGWHREMLPALDTLARNAPSPHPPGHHDDFDGWNARFVTAKADAGMPQVLAELETSHRDFVKAAALVPEAHFEPGGDARGLVEGNGPGHYREHAGQIVAWRQQAGVPAAR